MRGSSETGFTLVEMLVALTIFAVLAASGVALTRSSVDAQQAIGRRLDTVDAQARLVQLFASDVSQAMARPLDGIGEARRLPFEGGPTSLSLIRGGWANLDAKPRSSLQRVEWRGDATGLQRNAHLFLDGSDPGQEALMLRGRAAMAFRYRTADGNWSDSFRSGPAELLPAAVELTVSAEGRPPLTVVAALPPRGPEPAAPVAPVEEPAA